jgi:tetratricopeptide (TPR) repeat protein
MRGNSLFLWLAIISMWFGLVFGQMSAGPGVFGCQPSSKCPARVCARHDRTLAAPSELQRFYELLLESELEDAVLLGRHLRQHRPEDPQVSVFLGFALRGQGEIDEAIEVLQHAYRNADKRGRLAAQVRIDALTGLVCAYRSAERDNESLLSLREGLRLAREQEEQNPTRASAYQLACLHAQAYAYFSTKESVAIPSFARVQRDASNRSLESAMKYLQKAKDRGFDNFEHLQADIDLAPVRETYEFTALLADFS